MSVSGQTRRSSVEPRAICYTFDTGHFARHSETCSPNDHGKNRCIPVTGHKQVCVPR